MITIALLALYFKKDDDDDDNDDGSGNRGNKGPVRLLSLIPAIGAIVAFILTEDMTTKMQLTDKWTILMAVICAVNVVIAVFSHKKQDAGDTEPEAGQDI